jgi:hypothetical protein
MKLYTQTNVPPYALARALFQEAHREGFDIIEKEIGKCSPSNAEEWQSRLQGLEDRLREEFGCEVDVPMPKSKRAWKRLLEACGAQVFYVGIHEGELHCVVQVGV